MISFGVAIWAVSAAVLGLGLAFASEPIALLLHAVIAPLAAGLGAWVWFRRFGRRGPFDTAAVFAGVGLVANYLIYAVYARDGVVLVDNLAGALLPTLEIFVVTFVMGLIINVPHTVEVQVLVEAICPRVFKALREPDPAMPGTRTLTAEAPPTRIELAVTDTPAPIAHQTDHVVLERVDSNTRVTWTTRFEVESSPLAGRVGRRTANRLVEELTHQLEEKAVALARDARKQAA
jgi:hypothetical protein